MSAKWTFWAWEQPIKSAPKKLALLQLANNANDDGKSWYSISKMAIACGVSERTFQRSIKDLEVDHLLHVERRSNRPSIYQLKDDEIEITLTNSQGDTESPLPTIGGDAVTGQGDSLSWQGDRESHDLNSTPNNDLNNSKHIDRFDEFWDLYAKKTGRPKCESKFKKLKDEEIEKIFLALPAYVGSTPEKKYRKDPMTWLNGQHWNDEIINNVNTVTKVDHTFGHNDYDETI